MFCRNCGKEAPDQAVMCVSCGCPPQAGTKFCQNCGVETNPGAVACLQCGAALTVMPAADAKSKLVAGILGILVGGLGVHRFYLGYIGIGIAQIVVTCITCGAGALWGFIEGILILTGSEKDTLADRMKQIGETRDIPFFLRDSENLRSVPVILLVGTETSPLGIPSCGFCGLEDCSENRAKDTVPCSFSTGDLGIALGSAAAFAAHKHIDNRIMFTAGKAAIECGLFSAAVKIAYGIPLSATGKNPFFDRK